jgi:hypothetical protein
MNFVDQISGVSSGVSSSYSDKQLQLMKPVSLANGASKNIEN